MSNGGYSYTITNGTISGTASLIKLGTGTVTLASVNPNYTGGTVIDSGRVVIPSGSNTLTGLSGTTNGTLQVGGSGPSSRWAAALRALMG